MFTKTFSLKFCSLIIVVLSSAAAAHAQQTHVFARGTDGSLMHFDGSRWESRGGQVVGSPDACSWGPDRIDVVVRGTNNHLMQIARVNGEWSGWYDHGGTLTSSPTCVSWGLNRIDLFARGADGTLIHRAFMGVGWTDWESLGGELAEGSGPDAASWGPNRLDVFVRGPDNALMQKAWDGTEWTDWFRHGGPLASDPGAVSWGPNRIDIFARFPQEMMQIAWTGTRWTEWYRQGGDFSVGSGPDAVSTGANRLEVFGRWSDNTLRRKQWDGTRWVEWVNLGGEITSDPGAVVVRGGASRPGPAAVARGRFRVTITGFRVNRETWDDILHNDGKHDEVFLVSDAATIGRNGSVAPQRNLRGAIVIGDTNNFSMRRRGGLASDLGGLKTGNQYPLTARLEEKPARYSSGGEPPFIAFEGEIIQGESAGVIIPTIWEWDEPRQLYDNYVHSMLPDPDNVAYANMVTPVTAIIRERQRAAASNYIVSARDLFGRSVLPITLEVSGTGVAASRPIGMMKAASGNFYNFTPKAFVLTYEAAMLATGGGGVGSFGAVRINYRDHEDLKGDYTLFLVIERLPDGE